MKQAIAICMALAAGSLSACAQEPTADGLVLVKGGTFQMGSPANEAERDGDETLHSVTVSDFYMAPMEVTQREYQAVMDSNPSERKGDALPVENVTWYDAIAYCNAKSQAEGLTPCYAVSGQSVTWHRSANGYRLPTEAEWEYAARGGTATPFWFGDYVHDTDANCYNAYGYNNDASGHWVNGYLRHTVEADRYNANAFGLKNMHGNVAEWTWDWYGAFPADVPLYATGIRLVRNAAAAAARPSAPSPNWLPRASSCRASTWSTQITTTTASARGSIPSRPTSRPPLAPSAQRPQPLPPFIRSTVVAATRFRKASISWMERNT